MELSLTNMMDSYFKENTARFHMPGHKGKGLKELEKHFCDWDITEIPGTDNLHSPHGAIADAQEAAAKIYGAKHTFFLVNGSSAGVLAMMLSLHPGEKILIQRDCHYSAINGIALAGLKYETMLPAYDSETDLFGVLSVKTVENAIKQNPDTKAVLIVSPNFYGLCSDLEAISEIVHAHGALLFVDAAHGAHLPFSEKLPPSPAGLADLWVNSTHKTMNALTQSAILHMGEPKGISREDVQRVLSFIQTSSPSYPIMASIEYAIYNCTNDPQGWDDVCMRALKLKQDINKIPGLHAIGEELIGKNGVVAVDATRLVVDVSERTNGYAANAFLREYGVQIEFADARRIGCILSPADKKIWNIRLLNTLKSLPYSKNANCSTKRPEGTKRVMNIREAMLGKVEYIGLENAVGRIVARAFGIYPPGTALFMPGERITSEGMEWLISQIKMGAALFGVSDGRICVCE